MFTTAPSETVDDHTGSARDLIVNGGIDDGVSTTHEDGETSPLLALSAAELEEQRMLLEEIERAKRMAISSSSRRQRVGATMDSSSVIPVTDAIRNLFTEPNTNATTTGGLSVPVSSRDVGGSGNSSIRNSGELASLNLARKSYPQSNGNDSLDLAALGIDDDALKEQRALMEAFHIANSVEVESISPFSYPPTTDRVASIDLAALGIGDEELKEQKKLLASYAIPAAGSSRSSVVSDSSRSRIKSTGKYHLCTNNICIHLFLESTTCHLHIMCCILT